jgi:hypothetical protein
MKNGQKHQDERCDVICVKNFQLALRIWPAKCFDFDRSAVMRHEKGRIFSTTKDVLLKTQKTLWFMHAGRAAHFIYHVTHTLKQ